MKRLILLTAFIMSTCLVRAQQRSFKDLVGRWEVVGDAASGSGLIVVDSSNIILTHNGERKKILSFDIDFSRSPIWFDFTVPDGDSALKVNSIMELIDNTHMKWQLFLDGKRATGFNPSLGEFFYLRRSPNSSL
ncbi:MAG TPA: hypothetical protein VEB63_04710 [Chitinophagaceae bacterium]|nr:hypothetical protein [Chitinophagaceae bacterium]